MVVTDTARAGVCGAAAGAAPWPYRRATSDVSGQTPMAQLKRFLPLAIMLLAIVAAFALGLDDYLSLDQLERNRARLLDLVERHPLLAPLAFMLIYADRGRAFDPGRGDSDHGRRLSVRGRGRHLLRGDRGDHRRDHRVPDRQDRARRHSAPTGRAGDAPHGGGLSRECLELPAVPPADSGLSVLAGQSRAGISRACRSTTYVVATLPSASSRAAWSTPASAMAWARCSSPAARQTSASSSNPRSSCRSSGWRCWPFCRSHTRKSGHDSQLDWTWYPICRQMM